MQRRRRLVAAVSLMSIWGCYADPSENDSDGTTVTSQRSAVIAPTSSGPMLAPRVMPNKATAAARSSRAIDDEIVVKFKEGTHVRLRSGALRFDAGQLSGNERALLGRHGLATSKVTSDVAAAGALLAGLPLVRHFERMEADLDRDKAAGEASSATELADLNLYFHVTIDPGAQPALLAALNALDSVEIAYAPPRPEDAWADVAPTTPSFTANQGYVNAAPTGIDARFARSVRGGAGLGVKVIDVESGWNVNHEDAPTMFTTSGVIGYSEHGAAVSGVVAAVANGYGMTGAANQVRFGLASVINVPPGGTTASYSVARAVNNAAASLSRGDIILIEQHAPGPSSGQTCTCNCAQFEYIAMEYWSAEFDAMHTATANGIHVVEAAGNGSMNLDSSIYNNAFDRATRDSRAILVGAGTGSGGRAPECWTNFGSRVDVQGWGDSVATIGYGDLAAVNGGGDSNQFYTSSFSGTSSASPIVVSAVADVQGARNAHGLGPATPKAMRSLLVSTGTAQTGTGHIGPLPDLRAAIGKQGLTSADLREQRIRGDFNGDGREDVIIVTANGSFEYLGNAAGGFTGNAWVRSDLTLGNVAYVVGDFNGDGRDDVIIVTANGSFEYTGLAAGGFTGNVWVRNDLPLGSVAYTVGDFNGDGRDDVIIVTALGSFEYTGLAAGGFTGNVWVRSDLPLGSVAYTAGDFNGDGRADVIIVTALGSFEYTGLAAGGFTGNVWVRSDLPLGSVAYTRGDFNGDGRDDVIIVTALGSFEYTGKTAGGFTGNVWVRNDLPLGSVAYTAGDFSGDGRDDVIIVTANGSFEYTGLAAGGFTGNVWVRSDLPLGSVAYARGDFNGDGRDDVIIMTANGSFEYTGLAAGGFTGNVWVRSDLPLLTVAYF